MALALLLMLALDALLAGSEEDLIAYIEQSGADIFVSQEGVKNMHMASSAITYRSLILASHAAGVTQASPVAYTTGIVSHDERIKDIADRVLWLEDGEFKDVVEMALDPVCGMSVDKKSAPAQVVVDGRTFYFCANGCRDEFMSAPERFLLAQVH